MGRPPKRLPRRVADKPTDNGVGDNDRGSSKRLLRSQNISPTKKVTNKDSRTGEENIKPETYSRPVCHKSINRTKAVKHTVFSRGLKKRVMRYKLKTEGQVTEAVGTGVRNQKRHNYNIWKKKLLAYIQRVRSEVTESDLKDWVKSNPWIMKYQGNPSSASDLRLYKNVRKNLGRPIEYGRSRDDDEESDSSSSSSDEDTNSPVSIDEGDTKKSSGRIKSPHCGIPKVGLTKVTQPPISASVAISEPIRSEKSEQSRKAERVITAPTISSGTPPLATDSSSGVHVDNERPSTSAELRRILENQNNPSNSDTHQIQGQGGTGYGDAVGPQEHENRSRLPTLANSDSDELHLNSIGAVTRIIQDTTLSTDMLRGLFNQLITGPPKCGSNISLRSLSQGESTTVAGGELQVSTPSSEPTAAVVAVPSAVRTTVIMAVPPAIGTTVQNVPSALSPSVLAAAVADLQSSVPFTPPILPEEPDVRSPTSPVNADAGRWKTCEDCGGKKPITPKTFPASESLSRTSVNTIQYNSARRGPADTLMGPAAAGCSNSIPNASPSKNGNIRKVASGSDPPSVQPCGDCEYQNKSASRKRKAAVGVPVLSADVPQKSKFELGQLHNILASIQRMNFLFGQKEELKSLLEPLSTIYRSVIRQQGRLIMPNAASAGLVPPNPCSPCIDVNIKNEYEGTEDVDDSEGED